MDPDLVQALPEDPLWLLWLCCKGFLFAVAVLLLWVANERD